jgi:hypothetical protein
MTRTNVHTLLSVLLWTAALVLLVNYMIQVVVMARYWVPDLMEGGQVHELGVLAVAAPLVVIGVLWLFADIIARLALARPGGAEFESELDAGAWQTIAFSAVGLYFALDHATGVARSLLFRFATRDEWMSLLAEQRRDFVLGVIGDAVGLLAGVALLFGARGLAGLVYRFRYGSPPTA